MVLNNSLYRRKLWVFFVLIIFCLTGLCVRVFYLVTVKGEEYSQKSKELQERERTISAVRGDILDRNGIVIATNETAYNISVIHNQITDEDKVIKVLSENLNMDEAEVRKKVEKVTSIEKIKNNVDKELGDKIKEYKLDGVKVDEANKRFYPNQDLFSKVIGFAGSDGQGVVGLETVYDEYLTGENGKIYTGSNIENASFGATNCAERTAIFAAYSAGVRKDDIEGIAIVTEGKRIGAPCGACRQVLSELLNQDTPIYLANREEQKVTTIAELLPFQFSDEDIK